MSTLYTNYYAVNGLQRRIVKFVLYWSVTEEKPIPRKEIFLEMMRRGAKKDAISYSILCLIKEKYLRVSEGSSRVKTSYVLLRSA